MPYRPTNNRQPPTTTKKVKARFEQINGTIQERTGYEETAGPSPTADYEQTKVITRSEMSCGCIYPDTAAFAVCSVCVDERISNPNCCAKHHVACRNCGMNVCWKHSRISEHAGNKRLCLRCHRKLNNNASLEAASSSIGRVLKFIFFK